MALWPVLASRGSVLSTNASVAYFLGLAGLEGAPQVTQLADGDPGGHNVPQPAMHGFQPHRTASIA